MRIVRAWDMSLIYREMPIYKSLVHDNIDRRKLPPYGDGITDNRDPFQKGG